MKLEWNRYAELRFVASLFLLGCMTRSLLSRKENIDHPTCSDASKPNCSHSSQSTLKDFLFHFFVQGFIEGARGGKGFFSVLYKKKPKVYSCFILYSDCKRYRRVPPASRRGRRGRRPVAGFMTWACLIQKQNPPQKKPPFFSIPRQAAISWLT